MFIQGMKPLLKFENSHLYKQSNFISKSDTILNVLSIFIYEFQIEQDGRLAPAYFPPTNFVEHAF